MESYASTTPDGSYNLFNKPADMVMRLVQLIEGTKRILVYILCVFHPTFKKENYACRDAQKKTKHKSQLHKPHSSNRFEIYSIWLPKWCDFCHIYLKFYCRSTVISTRLRGTKMNRK